MQSGTAHENRSSCTEQLTESGVSGRGRRLSGVVVASPSAGSMRVVCADADAARSGVGTGCALAEARALSPGLRVIDADRAADRAALERLAGWADCLSPVVEIKDDDSLLIDATGCQRLFGGDDKLLRQALAGVAAQGYRACAAIADTASAAWALARATDEPMARSAPGRVAASVAVLPIELLGVDTATSDTLRRVGVRTIEALMHLPRSSVAARFGAGVLRRLDAMLGDVPELLVPYRPPDMVQAQVRFAVATDRLDWMRAAVSRSVRVFCDQLSRRRAGVRRVNITFYLERGGHQTHVMCLSRATRDADALGALLYARLDALRLDDKVHAVTLWTRRTEHLDGAQHAWLQLDPSDEGALAAVADRLAVRLGRRAVVRARLADDHQPERACRYVSVLDEQAAGRCAFQEGVAGAPVSRVLLRLLERPLPIRAVSAVEGEAVPPRFCWSGREIVVAAAAGPQRLETGWWRGSSVRRDYFQVESDTGCHYWIFRSPSDGSWYLHGFFD